MFMEEEQPITSTNVELLEHLFMRGHLPFRFNFDVYILLLYRLFYQYFVVFIYCLSPFSYYLLS